MLILKSIQIRFCSMFMTPTVYIIEVAVLFFCFVKQWRLLVNSFELGTGTNLPIRTDVAIFCCSQPSLYVYNPGLLLQVLFWYRYKFYVQVLRGFIAKP